MTDILKILVMGYLLLMTGIGLFSMAADKHRAIKNQWRIPERTLLLIAFLGGGIGSFLGMYLFRHKTKHLKFMILLPLAAILYLVLSSWIL